MEEKSGRNVAEMSLHRVQFVELGQLRDDDSGAVAWLSMLKLRAPRHGRDRVTSRWNGCVLNDQHCWAHGSDRGLLQKRVIIWLDACGACLS